MMMSHLPSIDQAVSRRIVELMDERGYSLRALSRTAEIPRVRLALCLSGRTSVFVNELECIAAALGVSPADLMPPMGSEASR